MLKFIKGHMDSIDGIAIYPVISFIIFFSFFTLLGIVLIVQRKEYFSKMSEMPLDDATTESEKLNDYE